jgi:hypothetical protein
MLITWCISSHERLPGKFLGILTGTLYTGSHERLPGKFLGILIGTLYTGSHERLLGKFLGILIGTLIYPFVNILLISRYVTHFPTTNKVHPKASIYYLPENHIESC